MPSASGIDPYGPGYVLVLECTEELEASVNSEAVSDVTLL